MMVKLTFITLFFCGLVLTGIDCQLGGEIIYNNDTVTLTLSENSRSVSGVPGSRHSLEFILRNNGPQSAYFTLSQEGALAGQLTPSDINLASFGEKVINVRNLNMPSGDLKDHQYILRARIAHQGDWNSGGNNGGNWGNNGGNSGNNGGNGGYNGGNDGRNGGNNGGNGGYNGGESGNNGGNSGNNGGEWGNNGGNSGNNGGNGGYNGGNGGNNGGYNGGNEGYNGGEWDQNQNGGRPNINGESGSEGDGSNNQNGGFNPGFNDDFNGGSNRNRGYDGSIYRQPGLKDGAHVTVIFKSRNNDELDSKLPEIITEDLEADCDEDIPCSQQTWTALWRVKDDGSGLFMIKVKDTDNNEPFWWRDNFHVGSTEWVTVKAHVSCCAKGVDMEVEDMKNNNVFAREKEEDGEGLDLPLIIGVSVGVGVLLILLIVGGVCLFKKKYSPVSQSG